MREFRFHTEVRLVFEDCVTANDYEQAREMHDLRVSTLVTNNADYVSSRTEEFEVVEGREGMIRHTVQDSPDGGIDVECFVDEQLDAVS